MLILCIKKSGKLQVGKQYTVSEQVGEILIKKGLCEEIPMDEISPMPGKIVARTSGKIVAQPEPTKEDRAAELLKLISQAKDKTEKRQLYKELNALRNV